MILDVDDVVVNTFSWVTQEPQERKLQTKGTLNPKKNFTKWKNIQNSAQHKQSYPWNQSFLDLLAGNFSNKLHTYFHTFMIRLDERINSIFCNTELKPAACEFSTKMGTGQTS